MNIITYTPLLLQGAGITCVAWLICGLISLLLGSILGFLSSEQIGSKTTRSIIRAYSFITRGIPAYVQILIAYFVIPSLLGLEISGFTAASCALAICSSGYVTEIVKSGIHAISSGQWDACFALGFSRMQAIRYIIAPQTLKIILPSLVGEGEQLLKTTSLFAAIGITEITRAGMNIISRELNPLPIYCIIAAIYLLFSAIFNLLIMYIQSDTMKQKN